MCNTTRGKRILSSAQVFTVKKVGGDAKVGAPMEIDDHFEYRGSYMDLEQQTLNIEIWKTGFYTGNKFDARATIQLKVLAKGDMSDAPTEFQVVSFQHQIQLWMLRALTNN